MQPSQPVDRAFQDVMAVTSVHSLRDMDVQKAENVKNTTNALLDIFLRAVSALLKDKHSKKALIIHDILDVHLQTPDSDRLPMQWLEANKLDPAWLNVAHIRFKTMHLYHALIMQDIRKPGFYY
jgi:hypothetical protein